MPQANILRRSTSKETSYVTAPLYPDFALPERKDALIPQPQKFDLSVPDKSKDKGESVCKSAKGRVDLSVWLNDRVNLILLL